MENLPTKIIVPPESVGNRLDVFLSTITKLSRSQIQKLIAHKQILVNNKLPLKSGHKLLAKDQIIFLNKKTKEEKTNIIKKTKQGLFSYKDIIIVQKTPDYFIVEKPTGMLTHSTQANEPDSLAELMLKKFPELKKVGEDPLRPGIVHRLDKEASGLLVIARTEAMFEHLKKQFKNHTIQKEYIVLVHGKVAKDWDEIKFRIDRSQTNERMAALPITKKGLISEEGKPALTEFLVKKRFVNFTLLNVKIHTGRTHQIRAHMLAYNHPVVGDPLYFQKKQKRIWDEKLGRLFLHCSKITFTDLKGNIISAKSPLPTNLNNFLKTLK